MTMINLGAVEALEFTSLDGGLTWLPIMTLQVNSGARQALRFNWDVGLLDWVMRLAP